MRQAASDVAGTDHADAELLAGRRAAAYPRPRRHPPQSTARVSVPHAQQQRRRRRHRARGRSRQLGSAARSSSHAPARSVWSTGRCAPSARSRERSSSWSHRESNGRETASVPSVARPVPSRCAGGWRTCRRRPRSSSCTTPRIRWPAPTWLRRSCAKSGAAPTARCPCFATRETVAYTDGDTLGRAVPRTGLVLVQMPHAFRASLLRAAHASPSDATDDATLLQERGHRIVTVEGDPRNIHVTTPADLALLSGLVEDDPRLR